MLVDKDSLVAYALGMLSVHEARQIEVHLRNSAEDAATVRDYFEVLTAIVLSQEPVDVPEDAEARLLERVRSETPKTSKIITLSKRPRWQGWVGLTAAAAIAVTAWVGFLQPLYQDFRIDQRLQTVQTHPGTVSEVLLSDTDESLGTLVRLPDNRLFVVLNDVPPRGQVYQGWEIVDGTPVSLGTYDGRVLEIAQPLGIGSVFGVTLEPPGGSRQPTTTPLLLYKL